jgi:hypothetical protein
MVPIVQVQAHNKSKRIDHERSAGAERRTLKDDKEKMINDALLLMRVTSNKFCTCCSKSFRSGNIVPPMRPFSMVKGFLPDGLIAIRLVIPVQPRAVGIVSLMLRSIENIRN